MRSGTSARWSWSWCGYSPRTASSSRVTGFAGRQDAQFLDAPLAAAQHSQGDDRAAEQRGEAEADLKAEDPLAGPVDVSQVEQQRGLVEREADARAEWERERGLESLVVGDEAGRPAAEREQDPGYEVVDVAASETDVAERPPTAADPVGREPHEGEGEHETGQEVEQRGLAARRRLVALDRHRDGVSARPSRGLDCVLRGLEDALRGLPVGGATPGEPSDLTDHHASRRAEGHRRKPDRDPIGAAPRAVKAEQGLVPRSRG